MKIDEPLGWLDRIRLRAHLSMCGECSNVERQLKTVRALSTNLFSGDEEPRAGHRRARSRHGTTLAGGVV